MSENFIVDQILKQQTEKVKEVTKFVSIRKVKKEVRHIL